jgi:hypothetical protein
MQITIQNRQIQLKRYAGYDKESCKQFTARIGTIPCGTPYSEVCPEVLDRLTKSEDRELQEFLKNHCANLALVDFVSAAHVIKNQSSLVASTGIADDVLADLNQCLKIGREALKSAAKQKTELDPMGIDKLIESAVDVQAVPDLSPIHPGTSVQHARGEVSL